MSKSDHSDSTEDDQSKGYSRFKYGENITIYTINSSFFFPYLRCLMFNKHSSNGQNSQMSKFSFNDQIFHVFTVFCFCF